MGHSRNRKPYVGVLVLAGAALAGDKLLVGASNPESATASSDYAIEPAQWTAESPKPSEVPMELTPGAAERMELLHPVPGEATDAFAQPRAWLEPPASATAASAKVPTEDPGAGFTSRARLTGLSGSGDTLLAIVNGKRVAVGEAVDGFSLISVDLRTREAVFRNADGVERTLRVAGATSGNSASKR